MTTYQIDGVDLDPQPTSHEWSPPRIEGHEGDGAPIYARYREVTLENSLQLSYQRWTQYRDRATHTVYLPAPGTRDTFTLYNNVYIDNVEPGEVSRQAGIDGVRMTVIRVDV
jgi:hypothetical protein